MSKLFDQLNSEIPDVPAGGAGGGGSLFDEINSSIPDAQGGATNWVDQYAQLNQSWDSGKSGALYNVGQFAQGAGKGLLSTLRGASTLGESGIKAFGRLITPKSWEEALGFQKTEKSSADELLNMAENKLGMEEGQLTTPQNGAEKAGFVTEQILEFLVPSSKVANVSKGQKLLTRMGIEATTVGGQTAIQQGEFNDEVKTSALIGAAFPLAGAVINKATQPIKTAVGARLTTGAESGLFKIIKPVKSDIDKGFKVENIFKHGVEGNLGQILTKTETKLNGLYSSLKAGLQNAEKQGAEVNLAKVLRETKDEIFNISKKIPQMSDGIRTEAQVKMGTAVKNEEAFKNFAEAGGVKRIFGNLVDDVKNVTDKTYKAGLYEANLIKQGAGTKGAWHYLVSPDAKAMDIVYNAFYDKLKKEIERVGAEAGVKNIKQLNRAMSELIPIKSAVIRRMPVADRNNLISLTDSILGLGAVFNPKAIALLGLSKLSKSGRFMSYLHTAGERLQGMRPKNRSALGERIFGGDLTDLKNLPAGMSIKDITKEIDGVDISNTKKLIGLGADETDEALEALSQKELEPLGLRLEYNDMFDGYDLMWKKEPENINIAQRILGKMAKEFDIPLKVNGDGTVKMFHGTNKQSAESIAKDGFEPGSFLSSVTDEQVGGVNGAGYYGDTIVSADVDPRVLAFRTNGEFYLNDDGGVKNIIVDGAKKLRGGEKKYYHGSKADISGGLSLQNIGKGSGSRGTYGEGVYLTNNIDRAKDYGKVNDVSIKEDLKLFETDDVIKDIFNKKTNYGEPSEITKHFQNEGYDGIKLVGKDGDEEIVIFNPKNVNIKKGETAKELTETTPKGYRTAELEQLKESMNIIQDRMARTTNTVVRKQQATAMKLIKNQIDDIRREGQDIMKKENKKSLRIK